MPLPSTRPNASLPPAQIPQQLSLLMDEINKAEKTLLELAAESQRAQDEIEFSIRPKATKLEEALLKAMPKQQVFREPSNERSSEKVQTITDQMFELHEAFEEQHYLVKRCKADMLKYEAQLRQLRNTLEKTLMLHQQNPKVSDIEKFKRAEAILREGPTNQLSPKTMFESRPGASEGVKNEWASTIF
jgi:hypothetical protein